MPGGAQSGRPAEEVEVSLRRLWVLERGDVARPAARQILTVEGRAEQAAIGDAPAASADTSFEFAEKFHEPDNSLRIEDPVGVLRVLLEAVLHARHARGERGLDRPLAQHALKGTIEGDRVTHAAIVVFCHALWQATPAVGVKPDGVMLVAGGLCRHGLLRPGSSYGSGKAPRLLRVPPPDSPVSPAPVGASWARIPRTQRPPAARRACARQPRPAGCRAGWRGGFVVVAAIVAVATFASLRSHLEDRRPGGLLGENPPHAAASGRAACLRAATTPGGMPGGLARRTLASPRQAQACRGHGWPDRRSSQKTSSWK